MNLPRNLSLVRILLEVPSPANMNFQNRRGMRLMNGFIDAVDRLFEFDRQNYCLTWPQSHRDGTQVAQKRERKLQCRKKHAVIRNDAQF
jgi:hypothetical protein